MILVTGGAGYVGSVLIPLLVSVGYKVRVFDDFLFGSTSLNKLKGKIETEKGDIRKITPKSLKNVDSVIHLAALSNDPMADFAPKQNFSINREATKRLVNLSKKAGVKRFIFASSCSIYDTGNPKIREATEETAVNPLAYYSLSKFEAEKYVLGVNDVNFCAVVLRKGTIYGYSPRMRFDLVVNTMVKDCLLNKTINVYSNGEEWRPLIDVNDVAKAYLAVVEAPKERIRNNIFNISFHNFKVKDIALEVKKAFNDLNRINIIIHKKPGKVRSYKVSTKKTQSLLKFSAKVTIRKSVENIISQIKKNNLQSLSDTVFYNIDWMKKTWKKD
jgi:nucleoside-diphosphate-sugar epimerase